MENARGTWAGVVVWVKTRLGSIGFVFSSGLERNIGVTPCGITGCVGFGVLEIGFVLQKKGRFVERALHLSSGDSRHEEWIEHELTRILRKVGNGVSLFSSSRGIEFFGVLGALIVGRFEGLKEFGV